jgi:hypothetical protein
MESPEEKQSLLGQRKWRKPSVCRADKMDIDRMSIPWIHRVPERDKEAALTHALGRISAARHCRGIL